MGSALGGGGGDGAGERIPRVPALGDRLRFHYDKEIRFGDTHAVWRGSLAQSKRPSFAKRQKEQKRRDRQQQKAEKRAAREAEKLVRVEELKENPPPEDPDLEGIIPGPQPPRY